MLNSLEDKLKLLLKDRQEFNHTTSAGTSAASVQAVCNLNAVVKLRKQQNELLR